MVVVVEKAHERPDGRERNRPTTEESEREGGGERDSIAVSQRSHLTDATMLLHCKVNTCAEQRAEGPERERARARARER